MQPNSSPVTYLSASEFLVRQDARTVVQYCTDDDRDPLKSAALTLVRLALEDPTTDVGHVLLTFLQDASGMLESAVLRSARYSGLDLTALVAVTGTDSFGNPVFAGGNSAGYLKKVVSNLTMYGLITRRPGPAPPETTTHAYNEAIKALNDLSEGIRIFAFAEVEQAGLPATKQFTIVDQINNDLITARWPASFGTREIGRRFQPRSSGRLFW